MMDIEDALKELNKLKRLIERSEYFAIQRGSHLAVHTCGGAKETLLFSDEDVKAVVAQSTEAAKAKIEKLQPIIDMANLALKGLGE
jgi:hypothetical protein